MEATRQWRQQYSDKIDIFKKGNKAIQEAHYIVIKGLIHKKDIILIDIYAINIGAHKYTKQMLTDIKGENNSTLPTLMDRASGQKSQEGSSRPT